MLQIAIVNLLASGHNLPTAPGRGDRELAGRGLWAASGRKASSGTGVQWLPRSRILLDMRLVNTSRGKHSSILTAPGRGDRELASRRLLGTSSRKASSRTSIQMQPGRSRILVTIALRKASSETSIHLQAGRGRILVTTELRKASSETSIQLQPGRGRILLSIRHASSRKASSGTSIQMQAGRSRKLVTIRLSHASRGKASNMIIVRRHSRRLNVCKTRRSVSNKRSAKSSDMRRSRAICWLGRSISYGTRRTALMVGQSRDYSSNCRLLALVVGGLGG
jgi:hypothetical protein